MQDLFVTEETDVAILADFYCGLPLMDEYIHGGGLQEFLCKHTCKFSVVRSDIKGIVAMFVISKGSLFLDEDCKDDLEMKFPGIGEEPLIAEEWQSGRFASIEIDYLAVREDCRQCGKHIGSWTIHKIMSYASIYDNPLFLSVAAYTSAEYTAVPFYNRNGFWPSELPGANLDTLRMYRLIE